MNRIRKLISEIFCSDEVCLKSYKSPDILRKISAEISNIIVIKNPLKNKKNLIITQCND